MKSKIHYRAQNNLPLEPTRALSNPVHNFTPIF
jgi:hypothetical protein